jgi:hypothetical protein
MAISHKLKRWQIFSEQLSAHHVPQPTLGGIHTRTKLARLEKL